MNRPRLLDREIQPESCRLNKVDPGAVLQFLDILSFGQGFEVLGNLTLQVS
jgi:hypothetical protein